MNKNILVTGGAGFIGSHTVVELHNSGYTPIIVDNLSNSSKQVLNGLNKIIGNTPIFYQHNYGDINWLTKIIKKYSIKSVIHFAASKAVNESISKPLYYYENNIAGLINLLRVVEKTQIKNFVFSSSCTVYGEPDSLPISEKAPFKQPTSPYGATKQMAERIINDTSKALPIKAITLRYFNPIGAHPSGDIGELPIGTPANLVPFITQTAAGIRKKLTINGDDYPTPDGTCIRDYIHVVDLAIAHIKAMEFLSSQQNHSFETINIGTGRGVSVMELIKTFQKVNKITVPYAIGPRRQGDIVKIYADANKAKRLLKWSATKSIEDCLKDAWNWQQNLAKANQLVN